MEFPETRKKLLYTFAAVVVVILVYTLWQTSSGNTQTASIGVDSEKIGIAPSDGDAIYINFADITNVELIEKPDFGTLETGFTQDNLYCGTFTGGSEGDCYVCVNPQLSSYILIESADGKYIINQTSDKKTSDLYDQISKGISE